MTDHDRMQRCPTCGVSEAAGRYCTACLTPTGPACWASQERSEAQSAAIVRRLAKRAAALAETANPATVGAVR